MNIGSAFCVVDERSWTSN